MARPNIYRNQTGLLNSRQFDYLEIAIVGCGSIGSFLALGLTKLGFKNFILVDDDEIEPHNIPTQYYAEDQIGERKVEALTENLEGEFTCYPQKLFPTNKINADVVFICVDSLKQRKAIVKSILDSYEQYGRPKLIIDGRMHRLVFRVFTIPINQHKILQQYVQSTLEKQFEGACTEKGIIQNIFGVTALMIEQFRKVLTGQDFHSVINFDLEHLTAISSEPTICKGKDQQNNK